VIASPTRGFAVPPTDMPPVIILYPGQAHVQDEKGSVRQVVPTHRTDRYAAWPRRTRPT